MPKKKNRLRRLCLSCPRNAQYTFYKEVSSHEPLPDDRNCITKQSSDLRTEKEGTCGDCVYIFFFPVCSQQKKRHFPLPNGVPATLSKTATTSLPNVPRPKP